MMAVLYLLLGAWLAGLATRRLPMPDSARPLVWLATFLGAVLLGFQALAVLQLLTGAPVVTTFNGALLLLAVALVVRLRPARRPPGPLSAFRMEPVGAIPVATALTFALAGGMLVFGYPQGYEVLAYHLPLSVSLLQTHGLQAWDGNFPHTFPANASVLYALLLEALPEKLVAAADLLLLVPLVAAVYALCRLAAADRRASLYACCGLLGVPMIAFSSTELGADIGGIACVALAMYFALSALPARAAMPLAGLCAGLAFGFKSLHLVSALCIGLVACARGYSSGKFTGVFRYAARFAAAASLAGGFWLLRNGLAYGNPVHPVGLPVIGAWLGWLPAPDFDDALRRATQFEWVDSSWQWLVYPWTEPQRYGQNFKHSAGLGAFVAAAIPGTAVALGAAIARDGLRRHRVRAWLLFAVLFVAAIWWGLGDRQPRYLLAALPLAMPLLAWAVTQAPGHWRGAFDAVLALCIVAMLAVFLSRQLLQFGDRIVLSRQTARAQFYEYPPQIDVLPAGTAILNLADRSWHYPLAGAALTNRVVSMPAGRRMLGLPPSLTAPAAVRLQAAPLQAAGVTHVFVAGAALSTDACLRLDELARVERNEVNGVPLAQPRVLYLVRYLCR